MSRIRITETKVWEYKPNLQEEFYRDKAITSITDAMIQDSKDLDEGNVDPDDLAGHPMTTTYKLEIIK